MCSGQRIPVVVKVCHTLILPPGRTLRSHGSLWLHRPTGQRPSHRLVLFTLTLLSSSSLSFNFILPCFPVESRWSSVWTVVFDRDPSAFPGQVEGNAFPQAECKFWQMSVCVEGFNLSFLFPAVYSLRLVPCGDLPQRRANPSSQWCTVNEDTGSLGCRAGTEAETLHRGQLLPGLFLACSAQFLTLLRTTCSEVTTSLVGWAFHIKHLSKICPLDLPTGRPNGGSSSVEGTTSQEIPICAKLIETNHQEEKIFKKKKGGVEL